MKNLVLNVVAIVAVFGVVPGGLIFGLSGRWDLWNVWAYMAIGVALLTFQTAALYRKSPELLMERMKMVTAGSPGRVRWTVAHARSGVPAL